MLLKPLISSHSKIAVYLHKNVPRICIKMTLERRAALAGVRRAQQMRGSFDEFHATHFSWHRTKFQVQSNSRPQRRVLLPLQAARHRPRAVLQVLVHGMLEALHRIARSRLAGSQRQIQAASHKRALCTLRLAPPENRKFEFSSTRQQSMPLVVAVVRRSWPGAALSHSMFSGWYPLKRTHVGFRPKV